MVGTPSPPSNDGLLRQQIEAEVHARRERQELERDRDKRRKRRLQGRLGLRALLSEQGGERGFERKDTLGG